MSNLAGRIAKQIVVSRRYPVLDAETLTQHCALDTLLRGEDGSFLLYTTSDRHAAAEERVLFLECRDALVWLNETADALGSYWHFAASENQSDISENDVSFTSKANRR